MYLPAPPSIERTHPRWIIPLGVALATLVLASGLGYRYWLSTPQYSLLRAKSAFDAHDLATFEKYVAIDQCAEAVTDDVFAEALKKSRAQSVNDADPFVAAGRKMAEGLLEILKPTITGVVKKKAREYVSTGELTLSGVSGTGSSSPVDLEEIKNSIVSDGLHFEGVGSVTVDNNTATVELHFHNDKKNADQPALLEMRRVENYWQVSRWKNPIQWMPQESFNVGG